MSEEIKENSKITVMNNIKKVGIEDTIKNSYLDYSMSVIVSRALPDARDGLKPVHRRILFSMDELGLNSKSQFRKCARIVGDVLGKYHPHGDSSVYGALVRLAQDFNMRYTLVQGHGNFGSIDGDEAAAMRYTESKMAKITEEMLQDINKDTIDYTKNFDESLDEPTVLPAKLPNLLVNGSTGIAVGMATNIPPHNLKEVCNAICATIDNKEISSEELLQHIQGPDFPTGGIINGRQGILEAYTTGKGKLKIRGKVEVETEKNGRETIIITELPYQVNKARLVEKIAKLVREKKIDGIVDLRDESDREGMRIVIKLRKDTPSEIVINQLYKYTELQNTFGIIMLALVNNVPKILTLKELINVYINHRFEVITRRTQFDLQKAEARIHILNGFLKALDNIDEIIKIIKGAENADIAKEILETKFEFSEIQSKAILDMKLQKLTGLEREKIETEHSNLMTAIENFQKILSNENEVYKIIKTETNELKEKYSDERKTQIVDSIAEIDIEDLIKDEDCVVTITHKQYMKRVPLDTYKIQKRNGTGVTSAKITEEDFIQNIYKAKTLDKMLFFTSKGRVYSKKVYEIPEAGRNAKGKLINNIIELAKNEKVAAIIPIRDFSEDKKIIFLTEKGQIARLNLTEFEKIFSNGKKAIKIRENDNLKFVQICEENQDKQIFIATKNGFATRFKANLIRNTSRNAIGVKGIYLKDNDEIVSLEIVNDNDKILTVTENGFGKQINVNKYRETSRNKKGVINAKTDSKIGKVIGSVKLSQNSDIMLISTTSKLIRINSNEIREVQNRGAKGIKLMKLENNEKISDLVVIHN
jgi:DNA gyrase, A subunit